MTSNIFTYVIDASQLQFKEKPEYKYIVPDLLGLNRINVIYGYPGVGKSILALDMLCRCIKGQKFLGREVNIKPRVFFFSTDGLERTEDDIKYFYNYYRLNEGDLTLIGNQFDLGKDDPYLIKEILSLIEGKSTKVENIVDTASIYNTDHRHISDFSKSVVLGEDIDKILWSSNWGTRPDEFTNKADIEVYNQYKKLHSNQNNVQVKSSDKQPIIIAFDSLQDYNYRENEKTHFMQNLSKIMLESSHPITPLILAHPAKKNKDGIDKKIRGHSSIFDKTDIALELIKDDESSSVGTLKVRKDKRKIKKLSLNYELVDINEGNNYVVELSSKLGSEHPSSMNTIFETIKNYSPISREDINKKLKEKNITLSSSGERTAESMQVSRSLEKLMRLEKIQIIGNEYSVTTPYTIGREML